MPQSYKFEDLLKSPSISVSPELKQPEELSSYKDILKINHPITINCNISKPTISNKDENISLLDTHSEYIYRKQYVQICFLRILECSNKLSAVVAYYLKLISKCILLKYILRDCKTESVDDSIYFNEKNTHFDRIISDSKSLMGKIKQLMKFTNDEIQEREWSILEHFIAEQNMKIIMYFKKYALRNHIIGAGDIEIPKNSLNKRTGYYNNLTTLPDKFKFLIKDELSTRYDRLHSKTPYNFNFKSLIAQPITDKTDEGEQKIDFFRGQTLSNTKGVFTLQNNPVQYVLENNIKSVGLKYIPDLYLPNFAKTRLEYSPGLISALVSISEPDHSDNKLKYPIVTKFMGPIEGTTVSLSQQIINQQRLSKTIVKTMIKLYKNIESLNGADFRKKRSLYTILELDENWFNVPQAGEDKVKDLKDKYSEIANFIKHLSGPAKSSTKSLELSNKSKNFKLLNSKITINGQNNPYVSE